MAEEGEEGANRAHHPSDRMVAESVVGGMVYTMAQGKVLGRPCSAVPQKVLGTGLDWELERQPGRAPAKALYGTGKEPGMEAVMEPCAKEIVLGREAAKGLYGTEITLDRELEKALCEKGTRHDTARETVPDMERVMVFYMVQRMAVSTAWRTVPEIALGCDN